MRYLLNEFINNRMLTVGLSKKGRRERMYWVLNCRIHEKIYYDEPVCKEGVQLSLFG